MTKDEYIKYAEETGDWAPGWEAIENSFEKLYGNQQPRHYGTNMVNRVMFGGDQYLDGCSIYQSKNGYSHIVTFGMSELYANPDSFDCEYSKWGYEMTIKLPAKTNEECLWAIDMMSNLARYTFTNKKFFEPMQYISGGGNPIKVGSESKITALLVVEDTEIKGTDSLHGKLDFLQLVGIMQQELDKLQSDPNKARILVDKMKNTNPFLITDLTRTQSYL